MKTVLFVLLVGGLISVAAYAQQQSWAYVMPYPTASPISQVHFFNDRVGILIGLSGGSSSSGSSLLHTTDRGATWTSVTPDPALQFTKFWFVDSLRGWIIGASSSSGSGRVYATTNGGLSWGIQLAPAASFTPQDVFFFNANLGWVVGTYGRIYKTTDGGFTWVDRSFLSTPQPYFYGVRFTSPTNGVAVASGSYSSGDFMVANTSDGGNTWVLKSTGLYSVMSCLTLRPSSALVTVGSYGLTLQSTNSGRRWFFGLQDVSLGSSYPPDLNSVVFRDSLRGIAVGDAGTIARTSDGGDSWSRTTTTLGGILSSVEYFSSSSIAIGGAAYTTSYSSYNPAILISTDDGVSWSNRARSIENSFSVNAMAFTSPSRCYIAGSGYIYETADSGLSWTLRRSSTSSEYIYDMQFLNSSTGIAVGRGSSYYGQILRTTNSGVSWSPTSFTNVYYFYGVSFPTADTGYAVGSPYSSPSPGVIMKTTNGGASWSQLVSTPSSVSAYYDVQFRTANLGWASGDRVVCKTTDGGATWTTTQLSASGYSIPCISFPSDNVGYAYDYYGYIYKTINGGQTWQQIPTYLSSSSTPQMLFVDENRGWVTGSYQIYATTNGGSSWQSEFNGSNYVYALALSPGRQLWAGGSGSVVLKRTLPITVSVENQPSVAKTPTEYALNQNYPNPFNPSTTISYDVPIRAPVTLRVYDIVGKEIATLVDEVQDQGAYKVSWHPDNIASGVYFYRIQAGSYSKTKKLTLLR